MGQIRRSVLGAALLGAVAGAPSADAQTCTAIRSVPYVIRAPGDYCLTSDLDLVSGGYAIRILADDVNLDLGWYTLRNLQPQAGWAIEDAARTRQRVKIRNGRIESFDFGIGLVGPNSRDHLIENVKVVNGLTSGIIVAGDNHVVRHNTIGFLSGTATYAIYAANGSGVLVEDNEVWNIGMNTSTAPRVYPANIAIWLYQSLNAQVSWNRITKAGHGVFFDASTGTYSNNVLTNVTKPFVGGIDAGGNVIQ